MHYLLWGGGGLSCIDPHPEASVQGGLFIPLFLLLLQNRFVVTDVLNQIHITLFFFEPFFVVVLVFCTVLLPPPKVTRSLTWVGLSPCTPYPNHSKLFCRDLFCSEPRIPCDLQSSLVSTHRTLPIVVQIIYILLYKLSKIVFLVATFLFLHFCRS